MLTKNKHIMTSCQLLSNWPNWPNPAFSAHKLKSCPYEVNQMAGDGQWSKGMLSAVLVGIF